MRTQETKYGLITKGISYYVADPRFNCTKNRRIDEYKSKSSGEVSEESIMCIDHNDLSDQFIRGTHGEYNSECYGCWAGTGHTVNTHDKASKK